MSLQNKLMELERAKDNSLKLSSPEKYNILLEELQVELLKSILEHFQTNTALQAKEQGVGAKQQEKAAMGLKMPLESNGSSDMANASMFTALKTNEL